MKKILTVFLIVAVFMPLIACHKENDEDKIKKVITDIQAAGEKKDVRAIMNNLSKNYSDPRGFNHEGIRRLLVGYFFRYPKISVYINNITITVENNEAKSVLQAVLTSGDKTGSAADMIPQSLGVWEFDVTLKKESNDWKVISAAWREAEFLKPEK